MTATRNATKRRPRRGYRRRIILSCSLGACVLAAAPAEFITRQALEDKITAAAGKKLTGPVSASVGLTPALLDAVTGQIPGITVNAPSTALYGFSDVDATATLTGVSRNAGAVTTRRTRASVVLPPTALAAKLDRKYPGITISPDPATQSLLIGTGQDGPVRIQEHATLHGHTIELAPAAITVFGRPLPPNQRIRDKLTFHRVNLDASKLMGGAEEGADMPGTVQSVRV